MSVEYSDNNDGYYGGVNGCKSCDGWICAECFEGFIMNEWNMCVRMETTTEPSGTFFESEEEEGKFLESHMSTDLNS